MSLDVAGPFSEFDGPYLSAWNDFFSARGHFLDLRGAVQSARSRMGWQGHLTFHKAIFYFTRSLPPCPGVVLGICVVFFRLFPRNTKKRKGERVDERTS